MGVLGVAITQSAKNTHLLDSIVINSQFHQHQKYVDELIREKTEIQLELVKVTSHLVRISEILEKSDDNLGFTKFRRQELHQRFTVLGSLMDMLNNKIKSLQVKNLPSLPKRPEARKIQKQDSGPIREFASRDSNLNNDEKNLVAPMVKWSDIQTFSNLKDLIPKETLFKPLDLSRKRKSRTSLDAKIMPVIEINNQEETIYSNIDSKSEIAFDSDLNESGFFSNSSQDPDEFTLDWDDLIAA